MLANAQADIDGDLDENTRINSIKPRKWPFISRVLQSRGIIYAIGAAFLIALSNILVRKNKLFTGNENALVRYLLQFICMLPLAIVKKQNIFGKKEQRLILSLRGIFSCIGLIAFYSAISLINPSDAAALFNCSILFVVFGSRFILNEKLTLIHLISLVITFIGILLITQPRVFFLNQNILTNQTSENSTVQKNTLLIKDQFKIFGVVLALSSSIAFSLVSVILKYLANKKAHISIVLLYSSYYGIPCSILTSVVMIFTGLEEKKSFNRLLTETNNLKPDVYLVLLTGLISVSSQILINLALQLEDASKIAILKSTDLLFTFFLQHLILDIHPNILSTFGASMIFVGASMVLIYKIIEKRHTKNLLSVSSRNPNTASSHQSFNHFFGKIIFRKF